MPFEYEPGRYVWTPDCIVELTLFAINRLPRTSDPDCYCLPCEFVQYALALSFPQPALPRDSTANVCCEALAENLWSACAFHENDPWRCPDILLVRGAAGVGLPIRDGGRSYVQIHHCPWCGRRL